MARKICIFFFVIGTITLGQSAIMPPPWANPSTNPCASQPRGWQLLYWPPDGKCYKIFQIGAPCPETMELGPSAAGSEMTAECRCPPGTAQSSRDALCHPIFTKASCPKGQFFAPVPDIPGKASSKKRWGTCQQPEPCSQPSEIYFPKTGKCYPKMSKGPCQRGELLMIDKDGLATCSCSKEGELGRYYWPGEGGGCHEHFTKGPCSEPGTLFLPGSECGCHTNLPNYYPSTKMCYQLGGIGPCPSGHHFIIPADSTSQGQNEPVRAQCTCKPQHVLYENGICYRIHTRGPCAAGDMLINSTTCVPIPCKRGRLYFPQEKTCYKIGSRGPCPNGQIVLYDYTARPSVDGITYNGVCGCSTAHRNSGKCSETKLPKCEDNPGMVFLNRTCYKLYSQGPCSEGEWLVSQRHPRDELWQDKALPKARCECRPGYKRTIENADVESNSLMVTGKCQPPAVTLARFLNENAKSISFS